MEREQIILDLVKEKGVKDIIFNDVYRMEHKEKFKKTLDCINNFKHYIDNKYNYLYCPPLEVESMDDYFIMKHTKVIEDRESSSTFKYKVERTFRLYKWGEEDIEDIEVCSLRYIGNYTKIENFNLIKKCNDPPDETFILRLLEEAN